MKKQLEAYLSGGVVMFVWQVVFLKLLGIAWFETWVIAVVSALLFFIVSVLMFESSQIKGGI